MGCEVQQNVDNAYRDGSAPSLIMFNDMSHLPADLRWTGVQSDARP